MRSLTPQKERKIGPGLVQVEIGIRNHATSLWMVLTPACCVTLGESLIFSGPQFPDVYVEGGSMRPEGPSAGESCFSPASPAVSFRRAQGRPAFTRKPGTVDPGKLWVPRRPALPPRELSVFAAHRNHLDAPSTASQAQVMAGSSHAPSPLLRCWCRCRGSALSGKIQPSPPPGRRAAARQHFLTGDWLGESEGNKPISRAEGTFLHLSPP